MFSIPRDGRLKFGERLNFDGEGGFTSGKKVSVTPIKSAESPLQVRHPQPIGDFDKEPVKIPQGHPLATSAPKKEEEHNAEKCEVHMKQVVEKQRKFLRGLTSRLEKSTAATNELIVNTEPTVVARKEFLDRIEKAEVDLDELEERVEREAEETHKFKKLCNKTLEKCTRTSKIVSALSNKVENMEKFKKKHQKAALNFRESFNDMMEINDTLKYIDRMKDQMKEYRLGGDKDEGLEAAELNFALLAVLNSLDIIKGLAPNIFKTESNPIGVLIEDTKSRIHFVDSMLVNQFPAGLRSQVTSSISSGTSLYSVASVSQETQPSHRLDFWPSASCPPTSATTVASSYHSVKSPASSDVGSQAGRD